MFGGNVGLMTVVVKVIFGWVLQNLTAAAETTRNKTHCWAGKQSEGPRECKRKSRGNSGIHHGESRNRHQDRDCGLRERERERGRATAPTEAAPTHTPTHTHTHTERERE